MFLLKKVKEKRDGVIRIGRRATRCQKLPNGHQQPNSPHWNKTSERQTETQCCHYHLSTPLGLDSQASSTVMKVTLSVEGFLVLSVSGLEIGC